MHDRYTDSDLYVGIMPQDINNGSLLFISSSRKMKHSSDIFNFLIGQRPK